jgi:hypothetical protein
MAGICSVCLAGCSRTATEASPAEFWQTKRQELLGDFDATLPPVRKWIVEICGEKEAAAILSESCEAYESLLPQTPYIGGESNMLTGTLYGAAIWLAFYRVMLAHGRSLDETGRIYYRSVEASAQGIDPQDKKQAYRGIGKRAQEGYRRAAQQSQESKYPGDWKFAVVEGDGQTFDFGVDYTECGIVKFFAAQKAQELTPYICLGDFPISRAMRTGLVRTTTLARGGAVCDFRFKTGRPLQMEWTPEFLKGSGQ